jgi:hypothetical protein
MQVCTNGKWIKVRQILTPQCDVESRKPQGCEASTAAYYYVIHGLMLG